MYIFIFMYIYAALFSFKITSNDAPYITFHKNLLHFNFSFFFSDLSLPQNKFCPLHVKNSIQNIGVQLQINNFRELSSFFFLRFLFFFVFLFIYQRFTNNSKEERNSQFGLRLKMFTTTLLPFQFFMSFPGYM